MTTNTASSDARALKWGGLALGLFVLTALGAPARADHGGGPGGHRGHRTPPPAAFDACKGKKAQDACQVTFGEHTRDGVCAAMPDGQLACRPNRPMGPPPEMVKACEGKKENDVCSATLGERTINGTCRTGRSDTLACRPERGPKT